MKRRPLKFIVTKTPTSPASWTWTLEAPNGGELAHCVGVFETRAAAVQSCLRITYYAPEARVIADGKDVK